MSELEVESAERSRDLVDRLERDRLAHSVGEEHRVFCRRAIGGGRGADLVGGFGPCHILKRLVVQARLRGSTVLPTPNCNARVVLRIRRFRIAAMSVFYQGWARFCRYGVLPGTRTGRLTMRTNHLHLALAIA